MANESCQLTTLLTTKEQQWWSTRSPAHLLSSLLLPGLGFHLLNLQRIGLPSPHKKVMVPDAQLQNLWPQKQETW